MALVSHQRCYYSNGIHQNGGVVVGVPAGNNNNNSSAISNNNSNTNNSSNSKQHLNLHNGKLPDVVVGAATSIQTAFDNGAMMDNPASLYQNNQTSLSVHNHHGSSNMLNDDSAGPSSSSSSTCSSLLAPNQTAHHHHHNHQKPTNNNSYHHHQMTFNPNSNNGMNNFYGNGSTNNNNNLNSSSGCSSGASPMLGGVGGGSGNNGSHQQQPDRPIGYGAFGVVWSVTDPRSGKRVALKKMPNVFQNLASCKRVFREIRILSSFRHDNILSCLDILQPVNPHLYQEIYVITELMQSDLHKIIVSPQPLTTDHVKLFLYQMLRGLKYLHTANIVHRDLKPGNLLVNSNCILKICDFGLARTWDPNDQGQMTHEVVTQYYRAPELLMGARRYSAAVDLWSIGCIFAELLGRRILFQAQGPIDQLNMIIDLLGTPKISEMKYACDGARCHVLKSVYRPPNATKLYSLSSQATHDAVHLLTQMLCFDPDQRITVDQALAHHYVHEGRLRFHSCMCSCCYTSRDGSTRVHAADLEPCHADPFDLKWEKELTRYSMFDLRDRIYKFIADRPSLYNVPLCINPHSAAFKSFTNSNCAQLSEMPPSPPAWD